MQRGRQPIDVIEHEHQLQKHLCDILEKIADGLPDDVDQSLCLHASNSLQWDLPLHHADEEEGLFPLLRLRSRPEDNLQEIISCLSLEHSNDACFAVELLDCLEGLAHGRRPKNPDMIGYMLRGFFEGYRRHLHWEVMIVLPLARRLLVSDDIEKLRLVMVNNRRRGAVGVFKMRQELTA